MATIQQADRTVTIVTPLEENELVVRSFTATERLGRPFQVEVELLSGNFEVKFEDLLGQPMTIRLETASGTPRFFNGFVSRFSQGAPFGRLARYHATIVPWFWFLTRTSDCRIFQNMTVPDIIKQVFRDRGFDEFDDALTGSYRTWEYCVQYRETDFNFVNRLMEQEGIYYFFEHEDGKHRLVLADGPDSHKPLAGSPQIPFRRHERGGGVVDDRECVDDWSVVKELQPGNYALESYDFKVPGKELRSAAAIAREHAASGYEMFDYPNDYVEPADGEKYAMMREQELQAQYELAQAHGDCRDVCAGFSFELTEFPREDQNREYLITSAQYVVTADLFEGSNGNGGRGAGRPFTCNFTALEARTHFRPPRVTPKPIIQGPQTAIVTGPAGQEIHLDEYGRVKVQFHWDRHGKNDENSSCWVRVSQGWAGKQWGIVFNPRIGQEVIVAFLEGDPDQPIITGRVYNGANMPTYAVPANGTQSGIKSRSSKGGGPANFNEIRMEDKKGAEELYFHAEKNQTIVVENDLSESIGHDESRTVGHDSSESIGNDCSQSIGANETVTVGSNRTETVGANETLSVGGSRTRTVSKTETVTVALTRTHTVGINEAITVGAAQEVTVGAAQTITVGAAQAITVGATQDTTVGGSQSNSVGGSQSTKVGGSRSVEVQSANSVKAGTNATINAGDEIMLKCGSSSIQLQKDGTVTIKCKDLIVETSASVSVKASSDIVMKGQKILQN